MMGDYSGSGGSTGGGGGGDLSGFTGGGPSGGRYYGGARQMATRGYYQTQILLARLALRREGTLANLQNAVIFSHVPRGMPAATVQTNVTPQVTRLLTLAAETATKYFAAANARRAANKQARAERQIQHRIMVAQSKAPIPTYQTIALTGLNMGPPIPGATYY